MNTWMLRLSVALLTLGVAACTASPTPTTSASDASIEPVGVPASPTMTPSAAMVTPSPSVASATTYPLTIDSCGRSLTFTESPKRVVSVGFGTLPTIIDLGLEDRIVGISDEVPPNTYPEDMERKLKAMPVLAAAKLGSGAVQVNTETILNANADMTLSPDRRMDWAALANAGIQAYSQAGWCENKTPKAAELTDINALYDEIAMIFNVPEAAAAAKQRLDARVASIEAEKISDSGTAALLYYTPGEGDVWTYGKSSMANVILDYAGLKNVYDDNAERNFKLNMEDLLARNPTYIVLVNTGSDRAGTVSSFKELEVASSLAAVKADKVMAMPFAWTDPASSLVVNGIEEVSDWVQKTK